MRYACLGCGKEGEISPAAAWPSSCECGSTSWTSAPFAFSSGVEPTGLMDTSVAANAALRQPGAPRIPNPYY